MQMKGKSKQALTRKESMYLRLYSDAYPCHRHDRVESRDTDSIETKDFPGYCALSGYNWHNYTADSEFNYKRIDFKWHNE